MPLWKTILLRSIGIGVAFALTVCTIIGLWMWYSSKPKPEKPWDGTAVKATWTDLTLSTDTDKCYLQFGYSLENTTDKDYAFPTTAKLLVRLPKDMSYT